FFTCSAPHRALPSFPTRRSSDLYTLEQSYGVKIVVPGAGFLLNNEMGDFNAGPGMTNTEGLIGTDPNLAAPGKRMLSSMSPTVRSEEHTSELQSRFDLVCRLLLE